MRILDGHSGPVLAVAYGPDGALLASAGWDGTVRLWSPLAGREVKRLQTANDHALALAFAPDGRRLAVGYRNEHVAPSEFGNLAFVPLTDAAETVDPGDTWFAHPFSTMGVAVSPDGSTLVTCGQPPQIRVWDWAERRVRFALNPEPSSPRAVTFSRNGLALAAAVAAPGGLLVWDLDRSEPRIRRLGFPDDGVRCVAYAPNGRNVVAGTDSGRLIRWRPGGGHDPKRVPAHPGGTHSVAYAPDGRFLITAGGDGLVKLWDPRRLTVVRTFDWGIGEVFCVAVAPDGLTAAAGGDGPVLVWDVEA